MREASPSRVVKSMIHVSWTSHDDDCEFNQTQTFFPHTLMRTSIILLFLIISLPIFFHRDCLSKRTRSFVWTFSLKLIVALELVRVCARGTQTQLKENFNFSPSATSSPFFDMCVCLWLNFPPNNVACDGEILPKTEEESRDDGANSAASSHRQQQ